MSTGDCPSDECVRQTRAGILAFVLWHLLRSRSVTATDAAIARRAPTLTPADRGWLINLAQSASTAGRDATRLPLGRAPDLDAIPINPHLPAVGADEPRILTRVKVPLRDPVSGVVKEPTIEIPSDVPLSYQTINELIRQEIEQMPDDRGRRYRTGIGVIDEMVYLQILSIERRY